MTEDAPPPPDAARRAVAYARGQTARAVDPPALPRGPAGYQLVRRIHQGGQGTVYEGLHEATGRRVAVKIMHAGLGGSAYNAARFQREIEILSELRHEHVVTLHDGGVTPSDHYFLVMDYVDGLPLDAWIRNHEPGVRKTVELFGKICMAIAAAHQRGIVHRDIKPSNIRIDRHDEPRVLDFGLAKMAGARAAGDVTASGQFIGSLPWATPEQAVGRPDLIDTRTDVYALGLVLFNMLTDDAPYAVDGPLRDVLNNVLETVPTAPSALRPGISADLDTIVLKSLAKEPSRRYQGAGALADDIACYLRGAAIAARRDSTLYLVRKLIGRHRWLTTAVVGLVAMSMITAVTTTVLLNRARSAEGEARDMAGLAAERTEFAVESLRFLVGEVSTALKHHPQTSAVRRDILDGASERLNTLAEEDTDHPVFWRERARAHQGLGEIAMDFSRIDEALDHFQAAAELRQRLVESPQATPDDEADWSISLVQLGDARGQLGDANGKLQRYEQALSLDRALAERYPDDTHYLDNLVWSYNRVGIHHRNTGHMIRSIPLHEQQLALARQLTILEPDNALRWYGLSDAHEQMAAIAGARDCVEDIAKHRRSSFEAMRTCLGLDPDNTLYIRRACSVFANAARFLDESEGRQAVSDAYDLSRGLLIDDPNLPDNCVAHATACARLGHQAAVDRDMATAVRRYREALAQYDHCLELAPDHRRCRARKFFTLLRIADTCERSDDTACRSATTDVLDFLRAALADGHLDDELFKTACQIPVDVRLEDPQAMLRLLDDLIESNGIPDNPLLWYPLVQAYSRLGRCDLALPLGRRALEVIEPDYVLHRRRVSDVLAACGTTAAE